MRAYKNSLTYHSKLIEKEAILRKCQDCPALIKGLAKTRCSPCQADLIDKNMKRNKQNKRNRREVSTHGTS